MENERRLLQTSSNHLLFAKHKLVFARHKRFFLHRPDLMRKEWMLSHECRYIMLRTNMKLFVLLPTNRCLTDGQLHGHSGYWAGVPVDIHKIGVIG